MKKTLKITSMILLAVMCMLIPQKMKKVNAATTIKTGEWYETKTNGDKSVRYSYKVPKSGYFYYEVVPKGYYYFQNNYQKGRSCFSTSLIKSYKEYERAGLASDDKKYKSGRYAFKAGDKVTINFEDSYDTKTPFKFRVVFKKVKNFEKENNNSKKKAMSIKKGKVYTGLLIEDDDDWFVFKAPKTKKYKIKVVSTNRDSRNEYVDVYKGSSYREYYNLYTNEGWKTVYSGKIKKGQKVFVCLYGGIDDMYKIKIQ